MTDQSFNKFSGYSLAAGGLLIAIFWLMVIPYETFAGAETALASQQRLAQVFHVAGALLLVYGLVGLYGHQRQKTGTLGLAGFLLVLAGTIGFLADGIIAMVVFPALAVSTPETIEAAGVMFTGAVLTFYIVVFAVNMIGTLVISIALWRAGEVSKTALGLLIAGGIAVNLPPFPGAHLILVAGGVLVGVGYTLIGNWLAKN